VRERGWRPVVGIDPFAPSVRFGIAAIGFGPAPVA
jgi:hypothetical protein